jgi:hypothetical protein
MAVFYEGCITNTTKPMYKHKKYKNTPLKMATKGGRNM